MREDDIRRDPRQRQPAHGVPLRGEKYRTGVYSEDPAHLAEAAAFIAARPDADRIRVEVRPLTRYVRSADEHQDRLGRHPGDYCHIPRELLEKHRA